MLKLLFQNGPYAGKALTVQDGKTVVMGRNRDVDLPLTDGKLSRRHCQVSCVGTRLVLRDLTSTNGTFVNSGRVMQDMELHAGDVVLLGDTEIAVIAVEVPKAEPAPRATQASVPLAAAAAPPAATAVTRPPSPPSGPAKKVPQPSKKLPAAPPASRISSARAPVKAGVSKKISAAKPPPADHKPGAAPVHPPARPAQTAPTINILGPTPEALIADLPDDSDAHSAAALASVPTASGPTAPALAPAPSPAPAPPAGSPPPRAEQSLQDPKLAPASAETRPSGRAPQAQAELHSNAKPEPALESPRKSRPLVKQTAHTQTPPVDAPVPPVLIQRPVPSTRRWQAAAALLAAACVVLAALSASLLLSSGTDSPPQVQDDLSTAELSQGASPAQLAAGPVNPAPAPASALNLLLGAATATHCEGADKLFDGDATNYDGSVGYAWYDMLAQPKGAMHITLTHKLKLGRIRFLLWDKDNRTYKYILSASVDGKTWKTLKDSSKQEQCGWQQIDFEPQVVLQLKLQGLSNSVNSGFHVVEFEAYSDAPNVAKRMPPPPGRVDTNRLKPGLLAEYYDGLGYWPSVEDRPSFKRLEPGLNFGCTQPTQPGQGLQNWPFSGPCAVIFSGYIKIEREALYTFFVDSDDGAVLFIDGDVVVDNDGLHGMQDMWGQLELSAGYHRLWLVYYNAGSSMGLNVYMKSKGNDKSLIPQQQVFCDPNPGQDTVANADGGDKADTH